MKESPFERELTPDEKALALQAMSRAMDALKETSPVLVHALWYAATCTLLDIGADAEHMAEAVRREAKGTADESRRREAVGRFH